MTSVAPHLRIARPVGDLSKTKGMDYRGLGLDVLGSFQDYRIVRQDAEWKNAG